MRWERGGERRLPDLNRCYGSLRGRTCGGDEEEEEEGGKKKGGEKQHVDIAM